MAATFAFSLRGVSADDDGQVDKAQRGMDVLDAAYHVAHSYPGGVPALAPRMNMRVDTLMSKVSVTNTTHHLSLKEAVTMQEVTGNHAILLAMADTLGYDIQRTLPGNTDDPVSLHWQMVAAVAEFMETVSDAMTRGVSRNSMRRCDSRAADLQAHVNNLLGAMRAQLPHQSRETGQ